MQHFAVEIATEIDVGLEHTLSHGDDIARLFGWDADEVRDLVLESELGRQFRTLIFQRVVPNLKKLGLLTPRVREAFTRLEIIQFEDFDTDAADRALGFD